MPERTRDEHLARVRPRALRNILHKGQPKDWSHRVVWAYSDKSHNFHPICWKCARTLTQEGRIDPTMCYWERIRSAGTVVCSHNCGTIMGQHPEAKRHLEHLSDIRLIALGKQKRAYQKRVNELKWHINRRLEVKSLESWKRTYLEQVLDILNLSVEDKYCKRLAQKSFLGMWDEQAKEFLEERDFDLEPGLLDKVLDRRGRLIAKAMTRI